MSVKKIKRCGRVVEIWEKSIRIHNRTSQTPYFSKVIFLKQEPNDLLIEQLCDLADSSYKAGYERAKSELRNWLKPNK